MRRKSKREEGDEEDQNEDGGEDSVGVTGCSVSHWTTLKFNISTLSESIGLIFLPVMKHGS